MGFLLAPKGSSDPQVAQAEGGGRCRSAPGGPGRPHVQSCVQPCPAMAGCACGAGPEEAVGMCGGLEHLSSAARLGEPGLSSLERSRVRGGLTAASQCLKRAESDGRRGRVLD